MIKWLTLSYNLVIMYKEIESTQTTKTTTGHVKMKYTFIDIEASSLNVDSFPIAIGVLDVDNESNNYETIIRPADAWGDWSEDAEAIHGITYNVLMNEGVPVIEVCKELNSRFFGVTLYFDSAFDLFWLNRLFETAKTKRNFLMSHVKKIVDSERYDEFLYDLQEAKVTHKPIEDARVLYQVSKGYLA
jgi:hypothetical protein